MKVLSCCYLIKDEGPEAESADNDAVDQALLAREPAHGHPHGRRVGQRRAQPKQQPVGQRGEAQALLYREVGQENAGAHQSAA